MDKKRDYLINRAVVEGIAVSHLHKFQTNKYIFLSLGIVSESFF